MYFKECINLILIIFSEAPNEIEQNFLIDIFNYISNNVCYRDKNKKNLNYTNKYYLLHNDYKTTKLIKLMNFIYKINNEKLTKIYFEFLINIYYFNTAIIISIGIYMNYCNLCLKIFKKKIMKQY